MRATTTGPTVAADLVAVTAGYIPGHPVLRDVSLRLDHPGLVHLTGDNGAGKSTLVEVLAGYLPPTFGEVWVGGVPAGTPAARGHRRICRTKVSLFPELAAGDHLAIAARLTGTDPALAVDRAARYGLGPWLDNATKALSTGNQRKLWLVMCTTGEAELIVLDEPFLGLDATGQALLHAEIAEWSRTACVVLIAHDLPDDTQVHDRVHLLATTERAA